jgi:hypothetical protein
VSSQNLSIDCCVCGTPMQVYVPTHMHIPSNVCCPMCESKNMTPIKPRDTNADLSNARQEAAQYKNMAHGYRIQAEEGLKAQKELFDKYQQLLAHAQAIAQELKTARAEADQQAKAANEARAEAMALALNNIRLQNNPTEPMASRENEYFKNWANQILISADASLKSLRAMAERVIEVCEPTMLALGNHQEYGAELRLNALQSAKAALIVLSSLRTLAGRDSDVDITTPAIALACASNMGETKERYQALLDAVQGAFVL